MKLILLIAIVLFGQVAYSHCHDHEKAEAAKPSGDSIYQLPSHFQDQDGHDVSLKSLMGQPVILAMAYTSCQASCPFIVENMKTLESDLGKKGANTFKYVLVSFDSKRDGPEKLKSYAQSRHLDLSHWTLFHGDENAVRDLAAVLGIRYKRTEKGEYDHSNIIFLIDSDGVVRAQKVGLSTEAKEFEETAIALTKVKSK